MDTMSDNPADRFFAFCDRVDAKYKPITDALAAQGVRAFVQHTGGGCMIIEIPLRDGAYAYVGDHGDGPLPTDDGDEVDGYELIVYSNDDNTEEGTMGYSVLPNWVFPEDQTYTADPVEFAARYASLLKMLGAVTPEQVTA